MREDDVRDRLAQMRTELEGDLQTIIGSSPTMEGIGFGKRVGDGTGIAVERLAAVGAHESVSAQLKDLERAEAKLAEGTYGQCDVCGRDIGEERLEARPTAARCMLHAARGRGGR